MSRKKATFSDENEASYLSQGEGEECPVCRQEFQGSCVLNRADCPCVKDEKEDVEEEEKSEDDFDDVKDLGKVLDDDEEADKLTEEEEEFDEETEDDER
jgi:hypothetical protein